MVLEPLGVVVEIDVHDVLAVHDNKDVPPEATDEDVIPLPGWFGHVPVGLDGGVDATGAVSAGVCIMVVENLNLHPGEGRIARLGGPNEDAAVAALRDFELEVEEEVLVHLVASQPVTSLAVALDDAVLGVERFLVFSHDGPAGKVLPACPR